MKTNQKLRKLVAKRDSNCYYSYMTGCGDIKEGDFIYWEGPNMVWHRKCMTEDYFA